MIKGSFRPEATVIVTTDFLDPATQPLLTERELSRLVEGFCPFHPDARPRRLDNAQSCGGWRWRVEGGKVFCLLFEETFCPGEDEAHGDPRDESGVYE